MEDLCQSFVGALIEARGDDYVSDLCTRRACASPLILHFFPSTRSQSTSRHGPLPYKLGPPRKPFRYTCRSQLLMVLQRNDAFDAYGTYPIHQRPQNGPKDAFSAGVQRTQ